MLLSSARFDSRVVFEFECETNKVNGLFVTLSLSSTVIHSLLSDDTTSEGDMGEDVDISMITDDILGTNKHSEEEKRNHPI